MNRFTIDEINEARKKVQLWSNEGHTLSEMSAELGVGSTTLGRWISGDGKTLAYYKFYKNAKRDTKFLDEEQLEIYKDTMARLGKDK